MMRFASFLGLLLLVARCVLGLAPTSNHHAGVSSSRSISPVAKVGYQALTMSSTSYGPMTILEDKPQLMIGGGRGYRNLLVDADELAFRRDNGSAQKKLALKCLGGYTAVVLLSFALRKLPLVLASLPYYYQAYPLLAGMATCGVKSAIADGLSQVQQSSKTATTSMCLRRNLSALTYGSTILGLGGKMAYTELFPRIFAANSGLMGAAGRCALDNFVFAPLIWLPGAYLVKALYFRLPVRESVLQKYTQDVRNENLLLKYWSLWVPAQLVNFSLMPKHLQVPFTAGIGFLWFLILSRLTYKKEA
ncbi:Mpv17 / PMP22 family [Seminavis robusta]|uniref:Mpv17 / PMP22 family n=1 Tax=Seminavis robusta TaxID=568900 RepID=A0A9N8EBG5_9STRA|nr:Mpv17 / PMP22 family [Seminavis robusta]|eukprot:Sro708_g190730.1 Mpv17 / PMP22 family (305) ;mRNA; f:29462-30376